MDQLITSLLDYVRLKANKLEVVTRPLDAAELLREAVAIFRPLARVKSLSLTLAIPDTPLWARADHDRMFQVLSNLLSNAIKFSSAEGNITVQATTSGHDLQIAVRDDGPGIPERDLDRVFEGFCQLNDSDARGLGLGLYISKAIVEAHGGRIWATSCPGAGSTFSFTVPRSVSASAPRRRRTQRPAARRPERRSHSIARGSELERNKRLDRRVLARQDENPVIHGRPPDFGLAKARPSEKDTE